MIANICGRHLSMVPAGEEKRSSHLQSPLLTHSYSVALQGFSEHGQLGGVISGRERERAENWICVEMDISPG